MDKPWFVRWGWLHRPCSAGGWLVTAAALAYLAWAFLAVDARSHSASDTLYAIYPHWGVTFLGWEWLAARTAAGRAR